MKKNYLFGLLSLFSVLFMASCQEEDVYGGASDANTGVVTFKVNTQQVGTRAATGEGQLADSLYYGVYENINDKWQLVEAISKITPNSAQPISLDGTVVSIRLAKQKQYSVIFWAQSDSTMFNVYWNEHRISVKDTIYANVEGYDAFWACDTVTINGALAKEINLVRPFAQLNIGISDADLKAAQDASVNVVSSSVTVKGVPTSMNLMGGTVEEASVDNADDAVTYSLNAIPAHADWTFPVDSFQYLALNYVLVGNDKSLTNVELTYKDDEGLVYSNKFTDVPVRRNYRTNVYGDLLTNEADYTIDINAAWSGTEANIEVWDGKTLDAPVIDEEAKTVTVATGNQLAWLAASVNGTLPVSTRAGETQPANTYAGWTVLLDANIDLGNELWTPIGFNPNEEAGNEPYFSGTFDGAGYTISNLKIDMVDKGGVGLFGAVHNATFKNFTLENVDIKAIESEENPEHTSGAQNSKNYIVGGHMGAIAGYDAKAGTLEFENVHVKGLIKIEGETRVAQGQRIGGIIGGRTSSTASFKNVSVKGDDGSYIKGFCSTAGVAGQLQESATFEDVHTDIDIHAVTFGVGGIVGIVRQGSTFTKCTSAGDLTLDARQAQPASYSANYFYRVGGIAGCWSESATGKLTLTDCSYTGTLSSYNKEGESPEGFDYDGYVGRGYTLNNCAGSKVTIDGKEFVQAFNTANLAGIYIVDGKYVADNLTELQAIINNAPQGDIHIAFSSDIAGDVTIVQKEGVNLVIDGAQNKYNGKITVNGNGRSKGAETLTFKNINFDASETTKEFTFIDAPSKIGDKYNYSHNITIEGCTFTGNYPAVEVGSASFTGTYNLVMKSCTATKMHSALQVQSCDNTAYVDSVKAIDCKNGISFGNTARPTLKNSEITAVEYGVRGDGNASRGNLIIENTTVTAKTPLIVRKLTTDGYNVSLTGTNTLTSSDNGYQIVFTKDSDDKPYVEPTVDYTVSGLTKGTKVFPEREKLHEASGLYYNGNDANWESVFFIYDAEDLAKAASYFYHQTQTSEANGVTFELLADIDMKGEAWTPWTAMWITFNGNNHKISNVNVSEGWRGGLFGYLGASKVNDLTLENITINGAQAGILAGSVEGVTTNNVTITGDNSVSYKQYPSETWGGIGAVTGVLVESTINATIAADATIALNDNGIQTEAPFINFLSGYLKENSGTIVNNGTVSVTASAPIEANAKGVYYSGEFFNNPIQDAFVLQNSTLTGDATITIKRTYGAIVLEGITANLNGDAIVIDNESNGVMVLENCNITLPEGKKLIKSTNTIHQVFMANITINGEQLTQESAAKYLENVDWYQVADPSLSY